MIKSISFTVNRLLLILAGVKGVLLTLFIGQAILFMIFPPVQSIVIELLSGMKMLFLNCGDVFLKIRRGSGAYTLQKSKSI